MIRVTLLLSSVCFAFTSVGSSFFTLQVQPQVDGTDEPARAALASPGPLVGYRCSSTGLTERLQRGNSMAAWPKTSLFVPVSFCRAQLQLLACGAPSRLLAMVSLVLPPSVLTLAL